MPLDEIRAKAERLDTKTRRWRVVTAVFFILLLIKGASEVWIQTETLERAGDLLLLAALVYIAYRYRKLRLAAPPVALGRTNCREFYRAELVRQRDLSKDSWGFLLPFVPGMQPVTEDPYELLLNGTWRPATCSPTTTPMRRGSTATSHGRC